MTIPLHVIIFALRFVVCLFVRIPYSTEYCDRQLLWNGPYRQTGSGTGRPMRDRHGPTHTPTECGGGCRATKCSRRS
eukprot:7384352-Prymnesium_polylepis.1